MAKENEKANESPAGAVKVDDSSFDVFVSKYPLVAVDCYADWCGPCRMVAPIVEELAGELQGKVVFGKLDVDANPKISGQYKVQSIPTILIFKNGKYQNRVVGALPKSMLLANIQQYFL